jgi:hypothetical protein
MHGVAWVAVQTLASEAARTGLGEINGGLIELLAPVRATPRKHCKKITGRVYNTAHNYCTSCFACSLERGRERDMCVCGVGGNPTENTCIDLGSFSGSRLKTTTPYK